MKITLLLISSFLFFSSCKTSKNFLSRADEDRTLFDIVKTLNKRGDDDSATKALPFVYERLQQNHLKRLNTYKNYKDISRWDKIIHEYTVLQEMYDAISNSDAANRLVKAVSYQDDLYDAKQLAAEDYYQRADSALQGNKRTDARNAYDGFTKVEKYVPGYKDAKAKMDEAYRYAIINVVINPVQDNSFFSNTGLGNYGYSYSNQYFQQTLIRELGGTYGTKYPAKFFADRDASRQNIQPDWVVDLTLRKMDIPMPTNYTYSRNVSKQIENGTDTSGKTKYQWIYATINITKQSFTARGQMDVTVTDIENHRDIAYGTYNADYKWEQEKASYSGDRRALSNDDVLLLDNSNYNQPRKEDVLNELYRKLYPEVRDKISWTVKVNW